jgi:AcrR family transcriptional regulator
MSEGVAAAKMQRIAQDSGVSKGLIYAYFDDQSELLQSLMRPPRLMKWFAPLKWIL